MATQTKEETERNRQAIIREIMADEGLTRAQAEAKEAARFSRALSKLFK
jgi:hypothetical protein